MHSFPSEKLQRSYQHLHHLWKLSLVSINRWLVNHVFMCLLWFHNSCASFVGRLRFLGGRPQGINLGPGCVQFSIVVHELGHAIGFFHEHNRPDRDDYIIISSRVSSNVASQLERLLFSNTLGLGYDHASIMHYSTLGGIITSRYGVPFGEAKELSPLDIEKANRLYNCGEK